MHLSRNASHHLALKLDFQGRIHAADHPPSALRNPKVQKRGFEQNLSVARHGVAVVDFCLYGVKLVLENGQLHRVFFQDQRSIRLRRREAYNWCGYPLSVIATPSAVQAALLAQTAQRYKRRNKPGTKFATATMKPARRYRPGAMTSLLGERQPSRPSRRREPPRAPE